MAKLEDSGRLWCYAV